MAKSAKKVESEPEFVDGVYLFNWDEVPGDDNETFIQCLKNKFDIGWVKTAQIIKKDNDGTIVASDSKHNNLLLRYNNDKIVDIINNSKTHKCIAKRENGDLNIYEAIKYSHIIYALQLAFIDIRDEDGRERNNPGDILKETPQTKSTERDAKLYFHVLSNGFDQSHKKIAGQMQMLDCKTSACVGGHLNNISNRGYMFIIPDKRDRRVKRYYPTNPSILLSYALQMAKNENALKKIIRSSHGSVIETVKSIDMDSIRLMMQEKWDVFLERPQKLEISFESSHENGAWLNFCGWIDAFKAENIDIKIFSADISLTHNDFRKNILKLALNGFEGSFSIYTIEAKKNDLKKYAKAFRIEYPKVLFTGYVVSEHEFFNKCYRVATFGDTLGTVTIKHGSKYSGTLFYKNPDYINYINECFDHMREESISQF